jgi:predicted lipid-binding transport protein (Tim44 family)
MTRTTTRLFAILGLTVAMNLAAFEPADARRGGSFGSRGMRTFDAPRATQTAPQQTAPVQRSMTSQQKSAAPSTAPAANPAAAAAPARKGFLGGMGGGLLGGLVAGGLIGMLLGGGFGGLSEGLMQTLMQVALIGGVIALLMMLFRRRSSPSPVPAGLNREFAPMSQPPTARGFEMFGGGPSAASMAPPTGPALEIGLIQADRDAFERLLSEVQDAFGREDYAALRERTTPEIMSFLSEELGQNATRGQRNEVSGTRLLQADVAEAWREGDAEYATAALRYESIDVVRDRQSGALLSGDASQPTQATELWTFVRHSGGSWKLSAIQEA